MLRREFVWGTAMGTLGTYVLLSSPKIISTNSERGQHFGEIVVRIEHPHVRDDPEYTFDLGRVEEVTGDVRKAFRRRYVPARGPDNLLTFCEIVQEKPFSLRFMTMEDNPPSVLFLGEGIRKGKLDCDTSCFLALDSTEFLDLPVYLAKTVFDYGKESAEHRYLVWENRDGTHINFHPNWCSFSGDEELAGSLTREEIEGGIYMKPLGRDEVFSDIFGNLGNYYLRLKKDYPKAEEILRKAIEIDGKNKKAYFMLYGALQLQGKSAEALDALLTSTSCGRRAYIEEYSKVLSNGIPSTHKANLL